MRDEDVSGLGPSGPYRPYFNESGRVGTFDFKTANVRQAADKEMEKVVCRIRKKSVSKCSKLFSPRINRIDRCDENRLIPIPIYRNRDDIFILPTQNPWREVRFEFRCRIPENGTQTRLDTRSVRLL